MKIVIVDYGMGNIKSIESALRYLGVSTLTISHDSKDLTTADKLILPGVGSFARAMNIIKEKNLDIALYDVVMKEKKPILGICLGMQLMCLSSTENGENPGLAFVNSNVTKLSAVSLKIPHVGINQVMVNENLKLYQGMQGNLDFYFTHSFKANSSSEINQCMCNYGEEFIASFEVNNIAGVQFHPELSQRNGLKLLQNFIEKF